MGKVFYRGAVAQIAPEVVRPRVPVHLTSLVRKELIRPDRSEFAQEDAYRFIHILIRDAAYEAMPKSTRSELHEAVANWLTDRAGDRAAEYEEIVAYHLEQAHRYRAELGPIDEHGRMLGERAAEMLSAAGGRALRRSDLPAAMNLLERAVALMSREDPERTRLLIELGIAGSRAGEFAKSQAVLGEAIEWAEGAKDERLRAHGELALLGLRFQTDPALDVDDVAGQARRALEVLTPVGDHLGIARAWNVLAWTEWLRLRAGARQEALERAVEHAQRAGARDEELEALYYLSSPIAHGPMPVEEGLRRLDQILEQSGGDRRVEASVLFTEAALLAMQDRLEEARASAGRSVSILEELGHRPQAEASRGESFGRIETLAGDLPAAERAVRRACETLQAIGETAILSTQAADLAIILCAQGRFEEAEPLIELSRESAAAEDLVSQAKWRSARAQVLVSGGQLDEAVDLARAVLTMLKPSDVLTFRADVYVEVGRVLEQAGLREEAVEVLKDALAMYEQKGNVVSAERTRQMLTDLTSSTS